MQRKIYCLSGLGADQRIFQNLTIRATTLVHLPWQSFDEGETMESYALKMAALIKEEKPVILGLSFGGMLAVEIAKQRDVSQTILISSIKGVQEFPDMNSFIILLLKTGLIPYNLFKRPNKYLFRNFGAVTDEEKALLTAILKDTDANYLKHAFRMILNWKNTTIPQRLIHIHGTHDRILQSEYVHPDQWMQDGTHMMVWNKAAIIAKWIEDNLA